MTTPPNEGLLTPSDIAELAGVSRAAVSNWRKRMSDFPAPTGGSAIKPLFNESEIEAWLRTHPEKRKRSVTVGPISKKLEARLWGIANHFRGRVDVHEFGALCLQTAIDLAEGRPSLASSIENQQLVDQLRNALEGIPRKYLPDAIDGILERNSRTMGKSSGENGFIGSRTSKLLASLASDMRGGTLYDPACGIGVALLEALDLGSRPNRVVGHEVNAAALGIARSRAVLRGMDLELSVADVLNGDPDPQLSADVIIAEPPFGQRADNALTKLDPRLRFGIPPRSSSDTFWLQHVAAHLAPGGIGYVLTSPVVLFRRGAEAEIRRNLLLGGWVRAVVGLPRKMLPQTAIAPVLWVIGSPERSSSSEVLLIDASNIESPEDDVAKWLISETSLANVPHAFVPVDELATGNADLTPTRWIQRGDVDADQLVADFHRAKLELLTVSAKLPTAVQNLEPPVIAQQVPVLTIAELIGAGAIELKVSRPTQHESPDFEDRHVHARDIRNRTLATVGGLPAVTETALLTQPDDVLLTTFDRVYAVVDTDGGHVPTGFVARIRVCDRTKLDPQYLAEVLAGEWNLRLATGAAVQRIPVREIEIPVPSLADQQAIHLTISRAREAKQFAEQASEASESLVNTVLNSVRHGVSLAESNPR